MSTFRNIMSAAVVLGGAYLLYSNRHKLHDLFASNKISSNTIRRKDVSNDAMTEVYKSFVEYADVFQGLYEPLFKASTGSVSQERKKNIIKEWNIRMNTIRNIPIGLRSWWLTVADNMDVLSNDELQLRAEEVIRMLEHSGIIRDSRLEIVADNDTNRFYQHVDGVIFENGQRLRVESPSWYINGNPVRVIEKGYCEIM